MAFDTSGIRLKPCVDLFSTEASRQDAGLFGSVGGNGLHGRFKTG